MEAKLATTRRSGRTTRAVDEMVQHLFNHGIVQLWDHHPEGSLTHVEKAVFSRLYYEHGMKRNDGYKYDRSTNVVRLENFKTP